MREFLLQFTDIDPYLRQEVYSRYEALLKRLTELNDLKELNDEQFRELLDLDHAVRTINTITSLKYDSPKSALNEFAQFIHMRWTNTGKTLLNYSYSSHLVISEFCHSFATLLKTLPENKDRSIHQILRPGLLNCINVTDDEENLDEQPSSNFIMDQSHQYLLHLRSLITYVIAKKNHELNDGLRTALFNPFNPQSRNQISDKDLHALINFSEETQNLYRAFEENEKTLELDDQVLSVGNHLTKLAKGLFEGSVKNSGNELLAGPEASYAVIEFEKFLKELSEETVAQLFKLCTEEDSKINFGYVWDILEDALRLIRKEPVKHKEGSVSTCTETLSKFTYQIINNKNNHDFLFAPRKKQLVQKTSAALDLAFTQCQNIIDGKKPPTILYPKNHPETIALTLKMLTQNNYEQTFFYRPVIAKALIAFMNNDAVINQVIKEGNTDTLQFLFLCTDGYLSTLLSKLTNNYACKNPEENCLKLITFLLENDPNFSNVKDFVEWAAVNEQVELLTLMQKKKPGILDLRYPEENILHKLIRKKNYQGVQTLLLAGADVNCQTTKSKDTSLLIAIDNKDAAGCELLLQSPKIDTTIPNAKKDTPLYLTAAYGQLDLLTKFVSIDPRPLQWQTTFGDTPLTIAAYNGYLPCVNYLKDKIHLEILNNNNQSALGVAAYKNRTEIVLSLIETGANINIKIAPHQDSQTLISWAINKKNLEIIFAILIRDPKLSNTDHQNICAIFANTNNLRNIIAEANLNKIHIMLAFGVDPTFILGELLANKNITPENLISAIALLCDYGLDMIVFKQRIQPLLDWAFQEHQIGFLSFLNKKFPDLFNEKDNEGYTKLHRSIKDKKHPNPHAVILIQAGIGLNSTNNLEQTPIFTATLNQDEAMLHLLLSNHADTTLVDNKQYTIAHHAVSMENNLHILKKIITADPTLCNRVSYPGVTPLIEAIMANREPYVAYLCDKTNLELTILDSGMTPLAYSASKKLLTIAIMLINAGANVNAKMGNDSDNTLVDFAIANGEPDLLDAILMKKPVLSAKNRNDLIPYLKKAHEEQRLDIAVRLTNLGVKMIAEKPAFDPSLVFSSMRDSYSNKLHNGGKSRIKSKIEFFNNATQTTPITGTEIKLSELPSTNVKNIIKLFSNMIAVADEEQTASKQFQKKR